MSHSGGSAAGGEGREGGERNHRRASHASGLLEGAKQEKLIYFYDPTEDLDNIEKGEFFSETTKILRKCLKF